MITAVAAAVLGVTTLYVLAPLLGWTRPDEEHTDAAAEAQEDLLATRRELLSSIKDLEMEHQVGKLTHEDFEETRERLAREAVEVLRKLDEKPAGKRKGKPASRPHPGTPSPHAH